VGMAYPDLPLPACVHYYYPHLRASARALAARRRRAVAGRRFACVVIVVFSSLVCCAPFGRREEGFIGLRPFGGGWTGGVPIGVGVFVLVAHSD
jgi:hypothetical protein